MSEPSILPEAARSNAGPRSLFLWILLFEAGLGLIAWLFGPAPSSLWRWDWNAVATGILWTAPPLIVLALFWKSNVRMFAEFRELMRSRVVPLFATLSIPQLLVLAVAAGFGEEMLFRGLLQNVLVGYFDPDAAQATIAWCVIGATSLLFAALHALSALYFLFALAISVYLGWLYWASDNLAIPIVVHGLYDAAALILLCKVWNRPR